MTSWLCSRTMRFWVKRGAPDSQEQLADFLRDVFKSNFANHSDEAVKYLEPVLSEHPDDPEALLFRWWIDTPGRSGSFPKSLTA